MNMGEYEKYTRSLEGNLKEKEILEDLGGNWKIILKLMLYK